MRRHRLPGERRHQGVRGPARRDGGARHPPRGRRARHRLPGILPGRSSGPAGSRGHRLRARGASRRPRDRREDGARRRGRGAAALRGPRDRPAVRQGGGDPLLPPPAARAAARQRPPRPDLDRRLHRARRLLGSGARPGDGARGGPRGGQALRPARAWRRGLPHRPQVGGLPEGVRAISSTWSATPTRATPERSWTTRCSRATRTACSRA